VNVPRFFLRLALLIAGGTLREAARHRLFGCFLIFASAFVFGARWLREINFGAPELKFVADCGFGAMAFFGSALAIAAPAQLFIGEIEHRTILVLLAKPIGRAEFVVDKFLGTLVLVVAFCALLTGLLAAILWWREGELMRAFPDAFPDGRSIAYANLALAGFLQWLKLGVLAAFVLLIASFAHTQLFTIVAGLFVFVICHLQYLVQDLYARGDSLFGRLIGGFMASALPNFHVFAVVDPPLAADGMPGAFLVRVTLYGVAYASVACALAIFSFNRREF